MNLNNDVSVDYDDNKTITFKFKTKADAAEFNKLIEISMAVDAELLLYGDGALRTVGRKTRKAKKKS